MQCMAPPKTLLKKVAQYFQIENKLEMGVDCTLAGRIPLMK